MSPLQVRILRALDVPLSTAQIVVDVDAPWVDLCSALFEVRSEGWTTSEAVGHHLLWTLTPAGTEALAAFAGVPVDPADERASS